MLDLVELITCPHPFRMEREILHLPPGKTIQEILEEIQPNQLLRKQAFVSLDGFEIEPDEWNHLIPKAGNTLVIRVLPAGGGIGRIFVAIVALVATVVTTALTMGAAGPAWAAVWGGLAGAAVGIVGNLLLNALIPPSKPRAMVADFGAYRGISVDNQDQDTPTKFVDGSRNQLGRWSKLPLLLGYRRITPIKLAEDYTEQSGDNQFVRCLFGQYGPIEISDIKIGASALSLFEDVETEIREGYDTDDPITLYTQDIHEEPLTVELKSGETTTRTTQANVIAFSVDVTCPNGCYAVDKYTGNRQTTTVSVKVKYQVADPAGPWYNAGSIDITAATSSAIRRSLYVNVTEDPDIEYNVRLSRTTADPDTQTQNATYWSSIRSIKRQAAIDFPDPLALIAMRIRASNQLNGTVDELSFLGKSVFPDWDSTTGTWITRATNNPASLYRAVLQCNAAPREIADSRIDLTQLAYWYEYCVTKGFTYNRNVDQAIGWRDLLREIAAAGRAAPCEPDGLYSVVLDESIAISSKPLFTSRNTRGLEVAITYPDTPHAFRIPFNDEDHDYKDDERIVLADGYQIDDLDAWGNSHPEYTPATIFEQLDMPGVTNADQVFKLARYHLASALLRYRTFTFNTHFRNLLVTRGDVISYQHDVMLVGLGNARIKSLNLEIIGYSGDDPIYGTNIASFTMDDLFTLEEGNTYGIVFNSIRDVDGNMLSVQLPFTLDAIVGDPVETDTLTLATPQLLQDCPDEGDLGAFGIFGEETIDMVVNRIEMQSNLEARLVCLDASPSIQDADDGTIPAHNSHITLPSEWAVPEILEIRSDGSVLIRNADGAWLSRILITYIPPIGFTSKIVAIEAQYWRSDSTMPVTTVGPIPVEDAQVSLVNGIEDGVLYYIRLRYVRYDGRKLAWCDTVQHTVAGKSDPPNDVTGFTVYQVKEVVNFSWNQVGDLDLRGYEIRFGNVGVAWDDATILTSVMRGTTIASSLVPVGQQDFLIKAIDTFNNYSDNEARVTYTVINFYLTESDVLNAPLWAGTLTNYIRDPFTGYLNPEDQDIPSGNDFDIFENYVVNPYATSTYLSPEIDLGADDTVRAWARIYSMLGPDETGTVEPDLQVDYKIDGGAYDGFESWVVGYLTGRYVKFQFVATASEGLRYISEFETILDKSY